VPGDEPRPGPKETPSGSPTATTAKETLPPPALGGAERRHLRGLAHPLKPIVYIGEGGVSEAVIKALDEALCSHELVKVRLRSPGEKKEIARELAERSGSALCGVVGHTVILYRPHPDEPRITLPRRES
jgi:RNA-binding protein